MMIGLLVFTILCGIMTFLQFCSNKSLDSSTGFWDRVKDKPLPYTKLPYTRVLLESPGMFRHISRFVTRNWTYERLIAPNPIRLPWRHYAVIDQETAQENEVAIREWLDENTPGWTARGYERGSETQVVFSFRTAVDAVHFHLVWFTPSS